MRDLRAETAGLYQRYAAALNAGQRDLIATFYSREGTTIVFNGQRRRSTYAGIDSTYRGAGWQPPAFFAFDDLSFDPLGDNQVLVTGRFRWLPSAQADTLAFVYLAVVQAEDSGMAIRVEHETALPRRPAPR